MDGNGMELFPHSACGCIPFWAVAIGHRHSGFELQRGRVKDVPGSGQGHSGSRPMLGSKAKLEGETGRRAGQIGVGRTWMIRTYQISYGCTHYIDK